MGSLLCIIWYVKHCFITTARYMRFWHGMGHRFPDIYSSLLSLVLPNAGHVVIQLFHFEINTCRCMSHNKFLASPCAPRASWQIYKCLLFWKKIEDHDVLLQHVLKQYILFRFFILTFWLFLGIWKICENKQ